MAAASYTTDLAIHDDCTTVTNFSEPTAMTVLNGAGEVDADLAIYGTVCVSEAMRKTGLGALVSSPAARTIPTDGGFFMWFKWFAPNSLSTKTQGGVRLLVGNSAANYRGWYVDGNDTYEYGGWVNYVVDPTQTALATQVQGSPNTTYQTVGIGVNCPVSTPSKGNSYTIDILRYGRGEVIITDGDLANGYATFNGLSLINDNPTTGRWGLFQDLGGSYLWKGLMSLGTSGTSVDFRDANVAFVVDNTEMVSTAFNRIEIVNTASNVEWASVSISSLSTRSRGNFEVVDSATVEFTSCTFTDMGTFIFNGVTNLNTITSSTFRRCDSVTTNSGTLTDCLITNSIVTGAVGAVVTDNLADIVTCDFIRGASGHAVELTSLGGGTMAWNSIATGYAAGSAGTTTTANGNETIYVNVSTGSLTVTAAQGATVPSIRTAGATITVVVAPVVLRITVTDTSGVPIENARVQISATETAGTVTTGDVLLTGLTDVNGILENIAFVYQSAWDAGGGLSIKIKCRQGSVSPFKVPSSTVGTIVAGSGYQAVVALQPDE